MKKYITQITSSTFFKGSLVMVIGSNIYNFGQFIYHFLLGRMLGKVLYGDIASIISILGIVGIIQMGLSLTIVRYIAKEKDESQVSNFSKWIYYWSAAGGIVLAVVLFISTPLISKFLNISDPLAVVFLSATLLFFMLANSLRSILQGMLRFTEYVISIISESAVKIVASVVIILLGIKLLGAVLGMLLGMVVSFYITRKYLSNVLDGKRGLRPDISPLLAYTIPVFIQSLALTSMYTTDLLLVKHLFPADQAGIYASLTVLGRVVFFGTSPITQVMFPIITRKHSEGKSYHSILYLSLLLAVFFTVVIAVFYLVFPRLPILVLYGEQFVDGAPYLWWFAIFMGVLAIDNLLTQFYLSIGKTKIVYLFIVAAIFQAVLIYLFHESLLNVIQLSIISASGLLLCLLTYFPFHHEKK